MGCRSHTSVENSDSVDKGCYRHLPQMALLLYLKLGASLVLSDKLRCCNAFLKCFRNPTLSEETGSMLLCELSCHIQTR